MIQFYDDDHKARYKDLMQRMTAAKWDANRSAFAYLVTMDPVCHAHIRDSRISRMVASIPMLWLLHGRPAQA